MLGTFDSRNNVALDFTHSSCTCDLLSNIINYLSPNHQSKWNSSKFSLFINWIMVSFVIALNCFHSDCVDVMEGRREIWNDASRKFFFEKDASNHVQSRLNNICTSAMFFSSSNPMHSRSKLLRETHSKQLKIAHQHNAHWQGERAKQWKIIWSWKWTWKNCWFKQTEKRFFIWKKKNNFIFKVYRSQLTDQRNVHD